MLPLLAYLGVKWFDPFSSVLGAPVQGWVSHSFQRSTPILLLFLCQETWSEAQSKFEASPVVSWLFLPAPAGASEASRDVAELSCWSGPCGWKNSGETSQEEKSSGLLALQTWWGLWGLLPPLWLIPDLPLQPLFPPAFPVSLSRMFLQVNSCWVSSASQFLPLPPEGL